TEWLSDGVVEWPRRRPSTTTRRRPHPRRPSPPSLSPCLLVPRSPLLGPPTRRYIPPMQGAREFGRDFLQVFIPLFVAIDPFGMVPVFLGVTARMTAARRREGSFEACAAATLISIGFILVGNELFDFLGITHQDFRIAGGVILLV